ncbi:MAG: molybdopterin-dependent oxidoreductase [Chloroflexota bacterium]|nr:molybdopterin-dependent oxidoreductase [Chloroflexota bacterium]MDE2883582.1 molybdopterin-dependent oxidoreductase [Chloroflexota bacterium]
MAVRVSGLVEHPLELSHADLAALPGQVADVSTLAPGREGAAVRFTSVLEAASAQAGVEFLTLEADGGFAASIPLAAVADQALLLYALEGEPLPKEKGGPVRFLIPDPAACGTAEVDTCANVKFLNSIHLGAELGRDVRPSTLRAHEALHEAEREAQRKEGGA